MLVRDPETGSFNDSDLAAIMFKATESRAGAFKARGIPEVLRVVEIMGIEQARRWGAGTVGCLVSRHDIRLMPISPAE